MGQRVLQGSTVTHCRREGQGDGHCSVAARSLEDGTASGEKKTGGETDAAGQSGIAAGAQVSLPKSWRAAASDNFGEHRPSAAERSLVRACALL
jgi:hypothetical protein